MKLRKVVFNNGKREFAVTTRAGKVYAFPYAKADPAPTVGDQVAEAFVDGELGREAFTYLLRSGKEGAVHIDHILEYHEEPEYMARLLTYKLSAEARQRAEASGLSHRQMAKRLNVSVLQIHRLLDTASPKKSLGQLIALLHLLGCRVDLVVKKKSVA